MDYRKKSSALRLLLALMLMSILFMSSTALAQDGEEDPNVLAVTLIESETVLITEMDSIGSPQLYTFVGSEGDIVTISMVAQDPEQLDPFLVLLGSAGEVYAVNDDISSTDFSAQIDDFELPFDGPYFILATTFNDLVQGGIEDSESDEPLGYELGLVGATVPAEFEGVDEFEYFVYEMEIGDSVLLEITPDEPIYYVIFSAQAGDIVNISTRENTGDFVNTLLYVFDRFGNRLAVSSGGDSDGDFYAAIEGLDIPEDGMYLVFATASNFYQAYLDEWEGYGSFVFTIE